MTASVNTHYKIRVPIGEIGEKRTSSEEKESGDEKSQTVQEKGELQIWAYI